VTDTTKDVIGVRVMQGPSLAGLPVFCSVLALGFGRGWNVGHTAKNMDPYTRCPV